MAKPTYKQETRDYILFFSPFLSPSSFHLLVVVCTLRPVFLCFSALLCLSFNHNVLQNARRFPLVVLHGKLIANPPSSLLDGTVKPLNINILFAVGDGRAIALTVRIIAHRYLHTCVDLCMHRSLAHLHSGKHTKCDILAQNNNNETLRHTYIFTNVKSYGFGYEILCTGKKGTMDKMEVTHIRCRVSIRGHEERLHSAG